MTIRELARLAGVSRTTVSRALNNAPDVSKATKKRIVDLSKKLGYQANPMVTTLMSDVRRRRIGSRQSILAIVPPDFQKAKWGTGNIAHQLYRKGVERRANQLGFKVEDFMVADFGGSFKRLSQVLYQRGIQAVLVPSIDVKVHPPEYDYELDWDKFSVSGIGFSVTKPKNLDRAVMSQYGSAMKALERIAELGYRRIAFGSRAWVNERVQGRWMGAYLQYQSMRPELQALPPFLFEFGDNERTKLVDWFNEHRPEVILGERYLLKLMSDCGISVPEDVHLALMDYIPGEEDCVGMAGIDQRFESVGAATVDLIAERINRNERGLPEEPHVLKVGGRWVDGQSLPGVLDTL